MRIKPGYGYWLTDNFPIGGCFRRADKAVGEEIEQILGTHSMYRGVDTRVRLADGTTAALNHKDIEGDQSND
jgi:hypothetical protein